MPRTTTPFKTEALPFLLVPGVAGPESALPDSAHVFHIKGIGQDFTTSCVIFLANLNISPARSLDERLRQAYAAFQKWCHSNGKSSGIERFTKKSFDMSSTHGLQTVHAYLQHARDLKNVLQAFGSSKEQCLPDHSWRQRSRHGPPLRMAGRLSEQHRCSDLH